MNTEDWKELRILIRHDARQRTFKSSSCIGKHRFESFKQAQDTLSFRLRKQAKVYHCRECGGFHIGNVLGTRRSRLLKKRRRGYESSDYSG